MGNEERGDGADTEHLSDGGLQVGEVSSVAELWLSFPSDLSVELSLDLGLHLEEFSIISKISFYSYGLACKVNYGQVLKQSIN